jgi:hypothetical protein
MVPRMQRQLGTSLLLLTLASFQGCRSGTPPPPSDPSEGVEAPVTPAPEPGSLPVEPPATDAGVANPPAEPVSNACSKNEDCVPSSCCHPSTCLPRGRAPDCKAVLCTMECRPATLDCGGSCLCQNGQCAAKLNDLGGPS